MPAVVAIAGPLRQIAAELDDGGIGAQVQFPPGGLAVHPVADDPQPDRAAVAAFVAFRRMRRGHAVAQRMIEHPDGGGLVAQIGAHQRGRPFPVGAATRRGRRRQGDRAQVPVAVAGIAQGALVERVFITIDDDAALLRKDPRRLAVDMDQFDAVPRQPAAAAGIVDPYPGAAGGIPGDDQPVGGRIVVAQRGVHHQQAAVAGVVAVHRHRLEGAAGRGHEMDGAAVVQRAQARIAAHVPLAGGVQRQRAVARLDRAGQGRGVAQRQAEGAGGVAGADEDVAGQAAGVRGDDRLVERDDGAAGGVVGVVRQNGRAVAAVAAANDPGVAQRQVHAAAEHQHGRGILRIEHAAGDGDHVGIVVGGGDAREQRRGVAAGGVQLRIGDAQGGTVVHIDAVGLSAVGAHGAVPHAQDRALEAGVQRGAPVLHGGDAHIVQFDSGVPGARDDAVGARPRRRDVQVSGADRCLMNPLRLPIVKHGRSIQAVRGVAVGDDAAAIPSHLRARARVDAQDRTAECLEAGVGDGRRRQDRWHRQGARAFAMHGDGSIAEGCMRLIGQIDRIFIPAPDFDRCAVDLQRAVGYDDAAVCVRGVLPDVQAAAAEYQPSAGVGREGAALAGGDPGIAYRQHAAAVDTQNGCLVARLDDRAVERCPCASGYADGLSRRGD